MSKTIQASELKVGQRVKTYIYLSITGEYYDCDAAKVELTIKSLSNPDDYYDRNDVIVEFEELKNAQFQVASGRDFELIK